MEKNNAQGHNNKDKQDTAYNLDDCSGHNYDYNVMR